MTYLYLKALHIIFVVTWFAGLFYMVRLFIYHTEVTSKIEEEQNILIPQFKIMEKRLWLGITWPSAILTLIFGLSLVHQLSWQIPAWLWIKFVMLAGLYGYHFICHRMYVQLQKDRIRYSSRQLRIWNEVATLFLVSIVFLAVLKNSLSMVWGLLGLILFAIILMLAINIYKKLRKSN